MADISISEIKANIADEKKAVKRYRKQSIRSKTKQRKRQFLALSVDEAKHFDINTSILNEEKRLRKMYREAHRT